jgi:hypothetical protein
MRDLGVCNYPVYKHVVMKCITDLTLIHTLHHNMFIHWVITYTKVPHITDLTLIHTLHHNMLIHWVITYTLGVSNYPVYKYVVMRCMY